MTDAFDRLSRELRRAAPSEEARAKGAEQAMAAFKESFEAAREEETSARQGSQAETRLRSAEKADGRSSQRSSSMNQPSKRPSPSSSRLLSLPRKLAVYGGSGLLAAGLAIAIYGDLGDDRVLHTTSPSEPGETEIAAARQAPKKSKPPSALPLDSGGKTIDVTPKLRLERDGTQGGESVVDFDRPRAVIAGDVAEPAREATALPSLSEEEAPGRLSVQDALAERKPRALKPHRKESPTGSNLRAEGARAPSGSGASTGENRMAELKRDELNLQQRQRLASEVQRRSLDRFVELEKAARDRFEKVEPNPVRSVAEAPVSTFSIDVDTSAYSFMRASLNRGRLPHPSAVRIEEIVNYFDYDYEAPESAETPFKVNVAVTPTPWNTDTRLLHIGIKGYTPEKAERPKANLVLLADVSGSMRAQNKLPLAINAFKLLLGALGPEDRVSIVTYANGVRVALEPTAASESAKIQRVLEGLSAGGGTAGAAGLRLAYEKARENFDKTAVNRVILATDGDFNIGFSSPEEMKRFVETQRRSGVFLSVLGFGMGNYNSHLMQSLAQNGNGVAAYIDTLSEARKVLADEAGGALIPIAKDVKIQVEFNPGVISEYRLIGYETRALRRQDFKDDKVDAGDIGSGHTVTAIYEVTPKGSPAELFEPLRYSQAPSAAPVVDRTELALLKLRYKAPDGDVSQEIRRPVSQEDAVDDLAAAPIEARFAAAVSAFAQILRGDERLSAFGYEGVLALAGKAKGADPYGYRAEFLTLVRLAQSLDARGRKPAEKKQP